MKKSLFLIIGLLGMILFANSTSTVLLAQKDPAERKARTYIARARVYLGAGNNREAIAWLSSGNAATSGIKDAERKARTYIDVALAYLEVPDKRRATLSLSSGNAATSGIKDAYRAALTHILLAFVYLKIPDKERATLSLSRANLAAPYIKDPSERASVRNRIDQVTKIIRGK